MKWTSWGSIVEDCVKTCSTPTLLIFENIETESQIKNIIPLGLDEDVMEKFMKSAYKPSRVAKAGRIDLKQPKKTKDIIIEGSENFRNDSDPPVASISNTSTLTRSRKGGSSAGVSSHKPKPSLEDNWDCDYCGTINEEGR